MDPNDTKLHRMSQLPTSTSSFRVLPAQTDKTALIEDLNKQRAALVGKLVYSVITLNKPDNWVDRYQSEKAILIGINSYTDQLAQYQASQESDRTWANTQQKQ